MKFFAIVAASAFAVVSAQQQCNLLTLLPIFVGANGQACTTATGYPTLALTPPTGDQLKLVCDTTSCQTFFQELTTAVPTDCVLGGRLVRAEYLDKFAVACGAAPSV